MKFSPASSYFLLSGPNINLSNSAQSISSLGVSDQVSYPFKHFNFHVSRKETGAKYSELNRTVARFPRI